MKNKENMKRKTIALMCICCCMAMTACGKSFTSQETELIAPNEEMPKEISSTNQITEPQNQVAEESAQSSTNQVTESQNKISEKQEEELNFTICNFGDVITNDFTEMTVESASIYEELYPTDISSVYSYKPNQEGEQYFCLLGTIKNIGGNTYNVEDMYIEMIFDNKYTYTGYIAADDGGNDFFGNNVKPFGSVKYYMYSSIPDELINSYSTCTIKFAFKEEFKHDYHADFSVYDYRYQIELEKNNLNNVAEEEAEESNIDGIDSIDGNFIADLLEKYPEYVNELSNYVTSVHRADFANGKSFSDFDDYNEYFEDFHDWANEIIDYQGEVESEYQELWKEFQSLIKYHVSVLNESYNKDNEEALKLILQLMDYIQDKSKVISQLINELK